jgi:hypothetical protein
MEITESNLHSFVVKVWLEETCDEPPKVIWHGYITHVPDGERRYLKDANEVSDFIALYLKQMGVESESGGRIRRCLRRLSLRFKNLV